MEQRMAQKGTRSIIALVFLAAASACGPVINEAYMAKDSGGQNKTDTFFALGDQIHAIAFVNGGDPDTTLDFELEGQMSSELELYPWPNKKSLGEKTIDAQLYRPDKETGAKLTTGPWPLGQYVMHITMEGDQFADLPFEVIPN